MCRENKPPKTITIDVPSYLRPPRTSTLEESHHRQQNRPEPRPLPPVPVEQQQALERLRRQIDNAQTIPLNGLREMSPSNDNESGPSSTQPQEPPTRRSGRRRNRRSMAGPVSVESHHIFDSTWTIDAESQILSSNPSRSPNDRNYRRNMVTGELTLIRRGGRMSNLVGPDTSSHH